MKGEKQNMNKFITKLAKIFLGLSMAAGVGVAVGSNSKEATFVDAATTTGNATINFGSSSGSTQDNVYWNAGSSWSANSDLKNTDTKTDSRGNTWTIEYTYASGNYSRTTAASYVQIGASSKPAKSVKLSTTFSSNYKVTNLYSKWGGFTSTAGTVTMKVGSTTVKTGSLSGTSDVEVKQSTGSYSSGVVSNTIEITLGSISKGIKIYKISYTLTSATTQYTVGGTITNGALSSTASVDSGNPLNITLNPNTHYHLPTSLTSVTMGGNTLVAGTGYTYNSSTGAIGIASVTGNVVITATCPADAKYTVTYSAGTNGSGSYALANQWSGDYELLDYASISGDGKVNAADGYRFKDYTVGGETKAPGDTITLGANTTVTVNFEIAPKIAVYSVTARDAVSETGLAPTSSSMSYYNTYNASNGQMTSGNTSTWTLSGYSGKKITSIVAYCRKSNSASGSITTATNNGVDIISSLDKTSFSSNELTSSFKAFTVLGTDSDPIVINGDFVLIFTAAATSFYVNEVDISWGDAPVEEKEVASISVTDNSGKSWYAGDTLNVSDLSVEVTYDSGDPATITDGTGVYFDSNHTQTTYTLSQGTNSITVYYTDEFGSADNSEEPLPITAGAARNLSSISVTTVPSKTTYTTGESFDSTGMVVTATFTAGPTANVTNDCVITPSGALTLGTTSVTISYTYKNVEKTTTQPITVETAPTTITITGAGSSGTTQWKPTSSGSTFTDSSSNTATLTTDVPTAGWSGSGTPYQIGANDKDGVVKHGTWVLITIPLSERSGITAAAVRYCSNGGSTVNSLVYGDTENDVILNTSVTGTTVTEFSTSDVDIDYSTINASTIHFKFTFTVGCKIGYVSYTLGSTVQEFNTFTSLAIHSPTTDIQFKEGDTFSASGLVLRATDDVGFTKDFTTGFLFGTAEGDNSYSGATLDTHGIYRVYVTLTIGGVTKSVYYDIEVTEVPTYSLVNDLSTLYEGAKVLIVSGTNAAGAYGSTYLTTATVTFTGDDITDSGDALEFTIRNYGNKIIFQHGEYYLSYSGSNNQIQRTTTLSDSCAFYNDGTGLVSNVEGRYLEYCSTLNPSGFACVTSAFGSHVSLYISDKAPKTSTLGAETFVYKYLHMRDYTEGDGSCMNDSANHYYSTAKAFYISASFSSDEKVEFAKITDAVERLQAWARANGETFDPSTKTFSANKNVYPLFVSENTNTVAIIVIISMVSVTAIGGYFFLRKRKENI